MGQTVLIILMMARLFPDRPPSSILQRNRTNEREREGEREREREILHRTGVITLGLGSLKICRMSRQAGDPGELTASFLSKGQQLDIQ